MKIGVDHLLLRIRSTELDVLHDVGTNAVVESWEAHGVFLRLERPVAN